MPSFRVGAVAEILETHGGIQRVLVDLGTQPPEPAYALTDLTGPVAVGDRVVLNTTAVELGLGTGGWHVVHWNLERDAWSNTGTRTGMKLRYTSLQVDVENAEPPGVADLGGMPVIAADLHSHVGAIAVTLKHLRPDARLVYVMTDGGALPIAISDLVRRLRARNLIDATVTCGHAFGADLEAVSIPSALGVARRVAGADATIVAMGPGSAGTASPHGFSGVEVATALDATTALGGVPIAALRVSFADPRPRHRGVSHHTTTTLSLARSRARVGVPCVGGDEEEQIRRALLDAGIDGRHEIVDTAPVDVLALLAAHDVDLESMGRPAAADPVMFEAAAAAAVVAAGILGAHVVP